MRDLFQLWSSAFTNKQIHKIIECALRQPVQKVNIFSTEKPMEVIRSSSIRWLSDEWIKKMLWEYVKKANNNAFKVDVENHAEIQFTEYTAEQSDQYDWHHDVHWNGQTDFDRKISITLQLSDPKEYEGGDFEFDEINTNADFKTKGTLLIFPSYLRHRVLPVTSGVRRSLVAWFWGTKWK